MSDSQAQKTSNEDVLVQNNSAEQDDEYSQDVSSLSVEQQALIAGIDPDLVTNPTPMLRQYLEMKARYPDALLFFRLGDFYELFFEDARITTEILGITLTSRGKGDERIPMCGVPHHAAKVHVGRLVEAGYRVALCDQVEEPSPGKTLVRRDVTRVITPGTVFDDDLREAKTSSYLAGLVLLGGESDKGGAVALLEASTGDFRVFTAESDQELFDEISRSESRELLVDEKTAGSPRLKGALPDLTRTQRTEREFDAERGRQKLCRHFKVASLDGFGLADEPAAWGAAAAVLRYVEQTQRSKPVHVRSLVRHGSAAYLALDAASRRNLDLIRNSVDGKRQGSLLGTIDRTTTPMGARLLTRWLLYPLTEVEKIVERQEAVEELLASAVLREDLIGGLRRIGDLERLVSRQVVKQGNARDLRLLGQSLQAVPAVKALLDQVHSPLLRRIHSELTELPELSMLLERAIVEDPPTTIREGGMFSKGFHPELDELRELAQSGRESIARMEAKERERTGVPSLKIRYNRVFGYYIEITKANLGNVPDDYQRRQTLTNAERFVTPWLNEYEVKVLSAQERSINLELELFEELRDYVVSLAGQIQDLASNLARLDVLVSFSRLAAQSDYTRPTVHEGDGLRIIQGRHPVIEKMMSDTPFVPNDLEIDHERRLVVLTGPNMAGKSTAMRQMALIVVLAQMGSFVPAREASIGICDRIFTRVGAGDDLARGQSTFMVEMSETANILRHASSRSLVLLDEIGRGTSTFDGLAIAWAVAEHIHDVIRCRTIFATHYHELTELAHEKSHVQNLTMLVREAGEEIRFLRQMVAGAASRSYGVHVARLAGVPAPVLRRAREVLLNLENSSLDEQGHPVFAKSGKRKTRAQLSLGFAPAGLPVEAEELHPVLEELESLNLDALAPIEALQLLHRWKTQARDSGGGSLQ